MGRERLASEPTRATPSRQDQNQEVYGRLEQLNMSQNRLADLTGLTSGYISMLLTGKAFCLSGHTSAHPRGVGRRFQRDL